MLLLLSISMVWFGLVNILLIFVVINFILGCVFIDLDSVLIKVWFFIIMLSVLLFILLYEKWMLLKLFLFYICILV